MSERTGVVDLDDFSTWPDGVREKIIRALPDLDEERAQERRWERSEDKWLKPSPPQPVKDRLIAELNESMRDREIRVFHATRLVDFDEVRKLGLRALSFSDRFERLRALEREGQLSNMTENVDEILSRVDLAAPFLTNREGSVCATPLRALLHDGGCDVFYEQWGGEAVERIAASGSTELLNALKRVGEPAVVVFRIPAFGACIFSDGRLAETMIEVVTKFERKSDDDVSAWDVVIKADVPPDWVEDVYPPTDPSLRAPRK